MGFNGIFQVILADNNILRGPQLLPHLNGFSCLRELDLSAVGKSSLSSSSSTPFILDDKCIIGFFHALHTHFRYASSFQLFNYTILKFHNSHSITISAYFHFNY